MTMKDFENNEYKKKQCQMDSRFRGNDRGEINCHCALDAESTRKQCQLDTPVEPEYDRKGSVYDRGEYGRFPLSVSLGRSETKTRGSTKQQCRIAESGRSMVEMLGTLAIIGVLSIGGIAAYSYGMDKYRANATMNDINLRIVDLIAQAGRGGDLSLSEWPTKSKAGYDIALEKDATTSKNTGGIQVSGVPNRVCEMLGEMTEVSNITLKITGTEYTKGSCGEENVMVFFQSDVVNGIGMTQPCNGPVVDGVCQPCEDGTWDETEEQCMCPNGCPSNTPFLSSETNLCTICPSNAVSTGCGCDTGCPENYWLFDGTNELGPSYIWCYPCPEGSTSAGGKTPNCICSSGSFYGCWNGTSACKTRPVPCTPPYN